MKKKQRQIVVCTTQEIFLLSKCLFAASSKLKDKKIYSYSYLLR